MINVSKDLPFVLADLQNATEGIDKAVTASAFALTFGTDYGVEMADGKWRGLLARTVVVVDRDGSAPARPDHADRRRDLAAQDGTVAVDHDDRARQQAAPLAVGHLDAVVGAKVDAKADAVTALSMPSVAQKSASTKGRSFDTLITVVSSRLAASSLKRRTLVLQMPVATLGKMLSTTRVPVGSVTLSKSLPVSSKAGACEPTAGGSPTVWTGVSPRAVVAMRPS